MIWKNLGTVSRANIKYGQVESMKGKAQRKQKPVSWPGWKLPQNS